MNNMESLYNEFEQYFKDNQEKINYFLDVLKNVKEDRWEYEYESVIFDFDKKHIKTLKYDNIKIIHITKTFYDSIDECSVFEYEVEVFVDNKSIFKTDDEWENAELFRKIIKFVERAEKRAKGKK